jgi:hypothetical protein
MSKPQTYTPEEMSKIITVAIFGYVYGLDKNVLSKTQIKDLYDVTLEHINEGGFTEDLINIYDNDFFTEVTKQLAEAI